MWVFNIMMYMFYLAAAGGDATALHTYLQLKVQGQACYQAAPEWFAEAMGYPAVPQEAPPACPYDDSVLILEHRQGRGRR